MDGGSEAGQRSEHIGVDLPRVGLASDRVSVRESEELSHTLVKSLNLVVVAIEQG